MTARPSSSNFDLPLVQLKTFSKLVKLPVQAAALQRRFGRMGRCAAPFDEV